MKMNIKICLVMAMAAMMVFSQTCLYANESGNYSKHDSKKGDHFQKMTEELNLTPQQKEALTKEREEFASKSKDLKEKIRTVRTDLKAELDKPVLDKAKVDTLTAELKNMIGQQIQNRIDKVIAMKQILTPEQFAKMRSSMDERKHEKGEKGEKGYKHGCKDDPSCKM